jgi:hypothetical protein
LPKTPKHENKSPDFLLAEYVQLRQEILKRMEIQHQLITLSLTAFGVLTTIGLNNNNVAALLTYPIVTLFLTAAWSQHDLRIGQLGYYICKDIEECFLASDMGWEHRHVPSDVGLLVGKRTLIAVRGVFIGTQSVALLLAILKMVPTPTMPDPILLLVATIMTGITIFLLNESGKKRQVIGQ